MLVWGNNLTASMPYLKVFIKPESGLLLNVGLIFESLLFKLWWRFVIDSSLSGVLLVCVSSLKCYKQK